MKRTGLTCIDVTWDAEFACFDDAVFTDILLMLLNSLVLMTKQKIFHGKCFMLYCPLVMMSKCVNYLKYMLIEVTIDMETFNKSTKSLVAESSSLKHVGGCIGSTVQRDGTFVLVFVLHEHNTV